ncbi:hypothetical protein [uncultured Nostoc sp.]|uniref:hypothetical protein n=1 Tax=uncultured Nostoc sp. TaxID=340711 RepID=UPI0035CC6747
MSATYKADFNLWIEQTAQLLRSHRWHLQNLILVSLKFLIFQSIQLSAVLVLAFNPGTGLIGNLN